jgi:hypothetical protein
VPITWAKLAGPLFGNMIATLELDDRRATVWFEQPHTAASLTELARLELATSQQVARADCPNPRQ